MSLNFLTKDKGISNPQVVDVVDSDGKETIGVSFVVTPEYPCIASEVVLTLQDLKKIEEALKSN